MKKIFFALTIAAACYACGGDSGEKKPISNNEENKNSQIATDTAAPASTTTAPASTSAAATTAPAAGKDGKALIEASDCRTCHKDDAKLIGPSYQDVAKKYEASDANIKLLAGKILKGGQGVWGEIPMAPHPAVSEEDAEAMVKYILSMKK
jgi:cytochrome c